MNSSGPLTLNIQGSTTFQCPSSLQPSSLRVHCLYFPESRPAVIRLLHTISSVVFGLHRTLRWFGQSKIMDMPLSPSGTSTGQSTVGVLSLPSHLHIHEI